VKAYKLHREKHSSFSSYL